MSAQGGDAGPSDNRQTNVDSLADAVGAAGVDIGAEEEGLRGINERLQAQAAEAARRTGSSFREDRTKRQDFIEPGVLADVVKKIAAAFQLRTLEPDTIPFIALATRHRLLALINDSIAARDHRINATHLRAPPFVYPSKRKRRREDDDDFEDDDDDDEDEMDLDYAVREPGPAWDQQIDGDAEKLLSTIARVEREEERRVRRERLEKEEQEAREKAEEERIAAEKALANGLREAEEAAASQQLGPDGKPKKERKNKKKESTVSARNMTGETQVRLSDQHVAQALGGRNFAWANTGASSLPPLPSLNKPKPVPPGGSSLAASTSAAAGSLLADAPAMHDANRAVEDREEWAKAHHVVDIRDLLYALEQERGMGVGRGSGAYALKRAWATSMTKESTT